MEAAWLRAVSLCDIVGASCVNVGVSENHPANSAKSKIISLRTLHPKPSTLRSFHREPEQDLHPDSEDSKDLSP